MDYESHSPNEDYEDPHDTLCQNQYSSDEDYTDQMVEDMSGPDHHVESIRSVFKIKIDDLEQAREQIGKSIYKKEFAPFPGFIFQIKLRNIDSMKFSVSLKNCGKTRVHIRKFIGKNLGFSRSHDCGECDDYSDREAALVLLPGALVELQKRTELCQFESFAIRNRMKLQFVFECSVEFVLPKFSKKFFISV
jgi:hypothetical protein